MADKINSADEFSKKWIGILEEHRKDSGGKADEEKYSQTFWNGMLRDVFGITDDNYIDFEKKVTIEGNEKSIDGYILDTGVLIEQKSSKVKFDNDKSFEKTYHQALAYARSLNLTEFKVNWIIICNFNEFWIYNAQTMEKSKEPTGKVLLKELGKHSHLLEILVDTTKEEIKKEMEISLKAGEIIGVIYEELLKGYKDKKNEKSLESLNIFCVRIVFCLYAEDSGLFGKHRMFHDYIKSFAIKDVRKAIIELFKILNQTEEERDPYEEENLLAFPYVNGGLFADNNIEIPTITEEIVNLILKNASEDFDWSEISPTIFGAVFESTLNPQTRHDGGMHYTSIENIHKVIDPLFLNELNEEFEKCDGYKQIKKRETELRKFQNKLSTLTFLDPACGSGNFLTETYICIRKLENKVIQYFQLSGQTSLNYGENNPFIQVNISQFYGIEVNDFAVTVARTALWIAESQMMKETEDILHLDMDFLPLKTSATIVHDNALTLDWREVISNDKLSYIMGNPPFLGFTYMNESQKNDMSTIFGKVKNLDYVSAWYKKANDYINDTIIECGFVSTNSIVQGETVSRLWGLLDLKINFAYRTFKWNSDATQKAAVHCIIIGFSKVERKEKLIINFDNSYENAKNINPYLIDSPDILVKSRNTPICRVSKMVYGNKPVDGGNLIIEESDYYEFIEKEPNSIKYIKPLIGASE